MKYISHVFMDFVNSCDVLHLVTAMGRSVLSDILSSELQCGEKKGDFKAVGIHFLFWGRGGGGCWCLRSWKLPRHCCANSSGDLVARKHLNYPLHTLSIDKTFIGHKTITRRTIIAGVKQKQTKQLTWTL